jgi:hypothetical protein
MESLEDRADARIGKSCNGCTTQLPRRQRSRNLVNTSNSSPSGPNVESLLQKKFCMELAKTFMIGSMSRPSHVRNAVAMLLTTGQRLPVSVTCGPSTRLIKPFEDVALEPILLRSFARSLAWSEQALSTE